MEIKQILCPIDFSYNSKVALSLASRLAKEHDAELHLVYSYQMPFAYTDSTVMGTFPDPVDMEPDRKELERTSPAIADVRFRREFLIGSPDRSLVDYADENNIDLIVMSTHGRTGMGRVLMGSVAEAVVRRAPCPVLTIKTPNPESAQEWEQNVSKI